MEHVNIEWFPKRDTDLEHIAQIYSNGLEYAATTRRRQCSHFVYCKDFLHDVVWATLYNTFVEIHGFKYDARIYPIDLDLTRLLIANSSDEFFYNRIPNLLDFLHQVEKTLKLKRTQAFQCDNSPAYYLPGGVFLLEGSQRWMSSPPLLSMYTLFIRCGLVHQIGDNFMTTFDKIQNGETKAYQDNDQSFLKDSRPGIDIILKLGYRKIFYKDIKRNYPQHLDTNTLHHEFGIRGYSWGTCEKVPYWHRSKLLDVLKEYGITIDNLWKKPDPPPLPSPIGFSTVGAFVSGTDFGMKKASSFFWED